MTFRPSFTMTSLDHPDGGAKNMQIVAPVQR